MYSSIKAQIKVGGKLSPSISCNTGLTHSHAMTPFDAPEKQAF